MRGVSRAVRGWRRTPPSYTPGQPEALQPTAFPATRAQPSRTPHASQPQALRAAINSPKSDNYGNSDHVDSDPTQKIKALRDIIKFQQRFLHSLEPPATKLDIKAVAHAVTRAVEDSTNAVLSKISISSNELEMKLEELMRLQESINETNDRTNVLFISREEDKIDNPSLQGGTASAFPKPRGDFRAAAVQLAQASCSYILVLVDGDAMNFNPEYVTQGRRGGVRLAERFVKDVRKYIDNIDPAAGRRANIRIRVYANVVGLSKAYRHAGIIPEGQDLTDFVRGFNAGHENCDFMDVGPGRELADKKIIGNLYKSARDWHCRFIIFCACTDNGYFPLLSLHLQKKSTRLALVEGPPFASRLRQIAKEFPTTSFPRVFMSASLPPLPDADSSVTNPVAESAAAIESQPGTAEVKTFEASCGVDDESDTATA
ncbi:uncharacterized protein BDW70DRAFT_10961 [Aspergillus foveolatus]|uniref:uncharacterized protein n=1 Tax=Aspergillus foveolatus TaxID=210207 RepID=UPI003CCE07C1